MTEIHLYINQVMPSNVTAIIKHDSTKRQATSTVVMLSLKESYFLCNQLNWFTLYPSHMQKNNYSKPEKKQGSEVEGGQCQGVSTASFQHGWGLHFLNQCAGLWAVGEVRRTLHNKLPSSAILPIFRAPFHSVVK